MSGRNDLDLRERFEALRISDAEAAPAFASLRRRPIPPRTAWLPALTFAAASVVTIAILVRVPGDRPVPVDDAIAQAKALSSWTAPTDPLLIVSDLSIPDSVPSLTPSAVALPATGATASDSGDPR